MMPYNTRRKSLSLPSLGIHLPHASRAHRPTSKPTPTPEIPPYPPAKKLKRSHDDTEPLSPISSPDSKTGSPAADVPARTAAAEAPPIRRRAAEHTPPPSPGDVALVRKVDTDGINDDIVVAVIEQLEKTGNRPHLIRDLAALLASTNESIAQYDPLKMRDANAAHILSSSANPAALLSSRLSLYLKRPWTALAPCPLAKELIPVHPRKVFFYLTTQPRMPLPETSDDILPPSLNEVKTLTPSVSDHSVIDDLDAEMRDRSPLSPSPEVELYSPELEQDAPMDLPTAGEPFSGRSSLNPDGTPEVHHRPNRAPSPPLEADERGFTETATAVRARGTSLHHPSVQASVETEEHTILVEVSEETPEQRQRRDQELGYELFGQSHSSLQVSEPKMYASSPMIQARPDHHAALAKLNLSIQFGDIETDEAAWSVMSPETIEVDELDTLFSDF